MIFSSTPLDGVYTLDLEPFADERGFFARTVCLDEFSQQGLNGHFVQQSVSWNAKVGTMRGLHYQAAPYAEDKLVRVTRGAIYDVIVDIRNNSSTRGRWIGVELSAENRRQVYIPMGFAHGFQTMEPDTKVLYEMTVPYESTSARGIRWNDDDLAIGWPQTPARLISSKDRTLPGFKNIEA